MPHYKDVGDIRKENLNRVLSEYKGSIAQFGKQYEMRPAVIVQVKNDITGKYRMGTKFAREFEQKLGLPHGWMDHEHIPGMSEEAVTMGRIFDTLESTQKEVVKTMLNSLYTERPGNGTPHMQEDQQFKNSNG